MGKNGWFRNLLSLDEEGLRELQQEVKQWQGVARVFVHPFHEIWDPSKFHSRDPVSFHNLNPKVLEIESACIGFVRMKDAPPVIILEQETHIRKTEDRLAILRPEKCVYHVPTFPTWGIPKITAGHEGDPENYQDQEESWQTFTAYIMAANIRSLIVGGMFNQIHLERDLDIRPHNIHPYRTRRRKKGAKWLSYDIQGCVSHLLKEMARRGIDTELSCFAHPHSRMDVMRIEQNGASTSLYPTRAQQRTCAR